VGIPELTGTLLKKKERFRIPGSEPKPDEPEVLIYGRNDLENGDDERQNLDLDDGDD
jgi:hypothetical protein